MTGLRVVAILLLLTFPLTESFAIVGKAADKNLLKRPFRWIFTGDENISHSVPLWAGYRSGPSGFAPAPQPPGDTVGITFYDYWQNGSVSRNIAYNPGNGIVHFAWMYWPADAGPRNVRYNAFDPAASTWVYPGSPGEDPGRNVSDFVNAGFNSVDVTSTGAAVVYWHEGLYGDAFSTCYGWDIDPPAGSFNKIIAPPVGTANAENCQGVQSGSLEIDSRYIWPKGVVDQVEGSTVQHIIATESPLYSPDTAEIRSYIYYRFVNDMLSECNATADDTLGVYIAEGYTVNPVVVQDPASDRVAIIYLQPLYPDTLNPDDDCKWTQWQHDVAFLESTNGGESFLDQTAAYTNVTDYTEGGSLTTSQIKYKAYADVTALYDHNSNLHIVWNTPVFDPTDPEYPCLPHYGTVLWHWDSFSQSISLVYDGSIPDSFYTSGEYSPFPAFTRAIAKPNLAECDNKLYVSFTRFGGHPDTTQGGIDENIGGDYGDNNVLNGDIYLIASSDGGATWGPDGAVPDYDVQITAGTGNAVRKGTAVDITNTWTENCSAGDCHNENFASLARYSTGNLHIVYLDDNHAGYGVRGENNSEITRNAVMYMTYDCFSPEVIFSYAITPDTSEGSFFFPIAPNGAPDCTIGYTNSFSVSIRNTGNTPIDYVVSNNETWLIPSSTGGTIAAGIDPVADIDFAIGPVDSEGDYNDNITINLTSSAGDAELVYHIDVVVACSYFIPDYQILSTGCWSAGLWNVPRAGTAQRGDDGNMFWFIDSLAPMYDGGAIITYADDVSQTFFSMYDGSNDHVSFVATDSLVVADSGNYEYARSEWATADACINGETDWYMPSHEDTCVLIQRETICNNTDSAITVNIGEGIDWNFPDDSDGSVNESGVDISRRMVYQKGVSGSAAESCYGGAFICGDIPGAIVLESDNRVYPNSGYVPADIGNLLATHSGFVAADSVEDLNSVFIVAQNVIIETDSCFAFCMVKASHRENLAGLQSLIDAGKAFIVDNGINCPGCEEIGCLPGDANGSGGVDIDDVVYVINYIFGGGPEPVHDICCGDANGSGAIDIDDVVYLINYIFGGGPVPDPDVCD